jgi:1,4-alpha-glucan branching enzyme
MAKKTESGKKVSFQIKAEPGNAVFVAGTFNQWDPTQYRLRDNPTSGEYKIKLTVPPGRHEYKFVVNGVWCADPNCPDWAPNGQGSLNSVLNV